MQHGPFPQECSTGPSPKKAVFARLHTHTPAPTRQGEPVWRYMLSMAIADHTRSEWLTSFNETSEVRVALRVCVWRICCAVPLPQLR